MRHLFLSVLFLFSGISVYSQNNGISIGTTTPHSSAAFEIADTSKGILIPRMTMNQRLAIQNPAEGLMVYQTDSSKGFWYRTQSVWRNLQNTEGIDSLIRFNSFLNYLLSDNFDAANFISIDSSMYFINTNGQITSGNKPQVNITVPKNKIWKIQNLFARSDGSGFCANLRLLINDKTILHSTSSLIYQGNGLLLNSGEKITLINDSYSCSGNFNFRLGLLEKTGLLVTRDSLINFNNTMGTISGQNPDVSYIVPVGKKWKIENIFLSSDGANTCSSIWVYLNNIPILNGNNTLTYNGSSIWLSSGDRIRFFNGSYSCGATFTYRFSGFEFDE